MQPIFFPVLVLVALIGGRLLGVRLGVWRALLVAWLGLATAGPLVRALTGQARPPLVLVISLGLLAMMAWAGILELLASSLPEPPDDRSPTRSRHSEACWPADAATPRSP
jgi:hypothetical protein